MSGFSGTSFPFTTVPYYFYTRYTQLIRTDLDTTDLISASLGNGNETIPLTQASARSRQQYLFTAAELANAGMEAGDMTAIQLQIQTPGTTLPFLRVRLKQVTQDVLNPTNPAIDGFTEVYFHHAYFDQVGWQALPFYQAFNWDGTSNLLLDISYTGSTDDVMAFVTGHTASAASSMVATQQADHYAVIDGNGYLPLPTAALGMQNAVTVSFWTFGLDAALTSNTTIFEARDAANRRQMNVHLPWSDGKIYWDCGNDGTGYDRISKAANQTALAGRWNHWAFTKDISTGVMAIYLNGELWHSESGKSRPISATIMNVGADAVGNLRYPGHVDNISLWSAALNAEQIRQIMFTDDIPVDHPSYGNLLAHYPLNEGAGLVAHDVVGGYDATFFGPGWRAFRGKDLFVNWTTSNNRPNIIFDQGVHNSTVSDVWVVDSFLVAPATVQSFTINSTNDLEWVQTVELFPAIETYLVDENGLSLATYPITPEGTLDIAQLTYHRKFPAKFELLSMVTPYGNGLDLGNQGKTFTFDVTDFAPVLIGERYLSLEMGGEFQEEMDISFLFITGTPTRNVLSIENIWPFGRGWYNDIQSDAIFEPRNLVLHPEADAYKLRMSITGHGQNGEFVPREHYINLNGGGQDFRFDVWKACGENPVYPQGGTWIFDRAGWCPGMATDLHEYWLPSTAGSTVGIDYGVNGASLTEANYLVSAQLVSYGPMNFELDAAIEDIIRPSSKVEHERLNPACNTPVIVIKNNGAAPITSLHIEYEVPGGGAASYTWAGNLSAGEKTEVALPLDDLHFWDTPDDNKEFIVRIDSPNNGTDSYETNNEMRSTFQPAQVFEYMQPIFIQIKTNNRPEENRYQIRNAAGEVVMERGGMTAATTYRDEILLPAGCYSLTFEDDGGDGLEFWYWQVAGINVGVGTLSFTRRLTPTFYAGIKNFDPDFGGDLHYDFVIPQTTDTDEVLENPLRVSVYPNPTVDWATIECTGFAYQDAVWQLTDMTGRVLQKQAVQLIPEGTNQRVDLTNYPSGIYIVQLTTQGKTWYRELVKTGIK
ncbi:MAG: LamG-like jellyroll fold domain-containing protein [Saprospiraceae bacterium]